MPPRRRLVERGPGRRRRVHRRRDAPRGSRSRSATDQLCRPIIEALGDDFDELVGIVGPWGEQVKAAGGYPGAGPHDLAGMSATEEAV